MKRNVLLGGVAVFVVIVLAWYLLLYSPLGDDFTNAQTSTTAEERKTQDLQAQLARLTAQSKNTTRLQALLRKFDQAIPQKPDLGEFIIQLNQIAGKSGVKFLSIAPSPPAVSGSSSAIALSISVTGSFFQVKNYLTQMEKLERLVIIDGVNISAGGGSSSTGTSSTSDATSLSVSLTGRMFTRAAPAAAAGTPSTAAPAAPGGSPSSTTGPGGATSSSTAPSGSSTTGGT